MKYTVVWKPSAEAMLAHLWNTATDRHAVTRAANQIDLWLQRDPLSQGESRSGSVRVLVVPPLAVHFQVLELDRLVQVLKVWRIRG
jgi:hypothetical protein